MSGFSIIEDGHMMAKIHDGEIEFIHNEKIDVIEYTDNQLKLSQKRSYSGLISMIGAMSLALIGLTLPVSLLYGMGVEKLTCKKNTNFQIQCQLTKSTWMGLQQQPMQVIDNIKSVEWKVIEDSDGDSHNFLLHSSSDYDLSNTNYYDFQRLEAFVKKSSVNSSIQLSFDERLDWFNFIKKIVFTFGLSAPMLIPVLFVFCHLKSGNAKQQILNFNREQQTLKIQEITIFNRTHTLHTISFDKISLAIEENLPPLKQNGWYDGIINYTLYLRFKENDINFNKEEQPRQYQALDQVREQYPLDQVGKQYPLEKTLLFLVFLFFFLLLPIFAIFAWIMQIRIALLIPFLKLKNTTLEGKGLKLLSGRYSEVEQFSRIIYSFIEEN
jgi:hypothetical protein